MAAEQWKANAIEISDKPIPLREPEISLSNTTLRDEEAVETVERTTTASDKTDALSLKDDLETATKNLKRIKLDLNEDPLEYHCSVNRVLSGSSCDENEFGSSDCQFSSCASQNTQPNNNVNGSDPNSQHQGLSFADFYAQQMAMQMGMGMGMPMNPPMGMPMPMPMPMQMTPEMAMAMQMNPGIFMANNSYPMPPNYADAAAAFSNYSQIPAQPMPDNYGQTAGGEVSCSCKKSPSSQYYTESHLRDPNAGAGTASASSSDYCQCHAHDEYAAVAATASRAPDNGYHIQDLGPDSSYTGPITDEHSVAATATAASASASRAQSSAFDMPDYMSHHQSVQRPLTGEAPFMSSSMEMPKSTSSAPENISGGGCPTNWSQAPLNCCMPMNCPSFPMPQCLQQPCCPVYPQCTSSNNCLDVESFVRRMRAAQPPCFPNFQPCPSQQNCCYDPNSFCCPQMDSQCFCDNDRIQSQTVYSTDYKPYCGPGNNFNHFPNQTDCGNNCIGPVGCGICDSGGAGCCMPQMCYSQMCGPSACCATMPCCLPNPCCGLSNPCSPCMVPCPALYNACCQPNCFDPQQFGSYNDTTDQPLLNN